MAATSAPRVASPAAVASIRRPCRFLWRVADICPLIALYFPLLPLWRMMLLFRKQPLVRHHMTPIDLTCRHKGCAHRCRRRGVRPWPLICRAQPKVNARSATGGSGLQPGCHHPTSTPEAPRTAEGRRRLVPMTTDAPASAAAYEPGRASRPSTSSPRSRSRPSSPSSRTPPRWTACRRCRSRAPPTARRAGARASGTCCSASATASSATPSWRTPTRWRPRRPNWSSTRPSGAAATAGPSARPCWASPASGCGSGRTAASRPPATWPRCSA